MRSLFSLFAICLLAGIADAAVGDAIPHPRVTAVRLTAPIVVDGELTEAVWQGAPAFTDFFQRDPVEGAPGSERTEVRVAFDDDAIYLGARLWDSHPDSIVARLARRDVSISADRFSFYLDPYLDRRSGYYFMVNAAGTQYDGTLSNDGFEDASWDGVWSGAAHVDDRGWTCEMRIPFSQLRFNRGDRQVWGVNLRRVLPRKTEEAFLAYPPKKESGFVSRFGDLVGLDGIRPGRAVEVVPYATTRGEFLRHAAADPFRDGSEYTPEGGVDLRTSLGSRLTLNATANPDFGQVEVDPAVVNLSDVESFFDEKRPFFVEGASNFRFGNEGANDYWNFNWPEPMFFYSRRIGRSPQLVDDSAEYSDVPIGTRILGAAKITGKLTPTVNFGTLHALTGRETARYQSDGTRWDAEAEPLTYYGATHALKEFKDRRSGFGVMSTLAARRLDRADVRDALSSSSLMAGFDGWTFLDARKTYVISGWTALSRIDGSPARIDALQRSPRHYLQRPDRVGDRLDPGARSLTGFGSRYWLNKQNGNVLLNAAVGYMDPRFDVNEMGYMRYADVINGHAGTGYQWTTTNSWRRYANVLGTVFSSWDLDGDHTAVAGWASARTTWINNWETQVNVDHFLRAIDARRTRGGPLMLMMPGEEIYGRIETDEQRPITYFVEVNGSRQTSGSYSWNAYPSVEWKPVSNVTLGVGPGYERVLEDAQWVPGNDDPAATATYGHRYVFATLDQRTVYANVRLNWTVSPRLSLQLFAQPLVSSARFGGYKELARPRSYDFIPYGAGAVSSDGKITITPPNGAPFSFDDPDFDFKSLRGNAVLRWEYLPGSTFFLVWTQERVDHELLPDFAIRRSFDRLLDTKASNIFLVKATRYFSM